MVYQPKITKNLLLFKSFKKAKKNGKSFSLVFRNFTFHVTCFKYHMIIQFSNIFHQHIKRSTCNHLQMLSYLNHHGKSEYLGNNKWEERRKMKISNSRLIASKRDYMSLIKNPYKCQGLWLLWWFSFECDFHLKITPSNKGKRILTLKFQVTLNSFKWE